MKGKMIGVEGLIKQRLASHYDKTCLKKLKKTHKYINRFTLVKKLVLSFLCLILQVSACYIYILFKSTNIM